QARAGKIELAHGGTLFLDEIESMSPAMQAKLLRVLETKKVQRLGGSRTAQIDMRVVSASNVPVEDLVAQGKMRSDFSYRIGVIVINLSPLCQRREDIPLLVHNFLNHHPVAASRQIREISTAAMKRLMEYHWPGNIRQLQNVLERAIVLTKGRSIEEIDLPNGAVAGQAEVKGISPTLPLRQWLNEQEKQYLLHQLVASGGRIGLTAKNCGMDVKTLYRKMLFHGLDKKGFQ
ncbi:MAG: sigma 54-interacting transcriptional regulator, partial [Candidatus Aerophobetes bacterium]